MKEWLVDTNVLIIFFVRDDVLEKTFNSVRQARPRRLLLWQDGAREGREDDVQGIERCRKIVENIDWNCEVYKNYQTRNWGCDPSTFYSHKWAFSIVDKCIILEDDCVPSQSFYPFCKELLDRYENDTRINRICGFNNEEITEYCPYDYFFTQGGAVWGWATWKRVADTWEEDYGFANRQYEMDLLKQVVDIDYKQMYLKLSRHIGLGRPFWESINSYSRLLGHQLVIVPKRSLITNVGISENSTHSSGNIKELSTHAKYLLSMSSHELNGPIHHPKYVVSDIGYYNRISNNHYFLNKLESVVRRFSQGNIRSVWNGFLRASGIIKNDI